MAEVGPRDALVLRAPDPLLRQLKLACFLGGLAQSVAGSAGALLAVHLTGSDNAAGMPQAMLVAGSAAAAVLLSRVTARAGRTRALAVGAATAVLGCLTVILAAVTEQFTPLLVGSLVLGAGNTAVMLGRYAAAELADSAHRGRAMATVLSATTLGAVAGPNLLAPADAAGRALGIPFLAAAYVVAAVCFAGAALALVRTRRRPTTLPSLTPTSSPRLVGCRDTRTALAILGMANLVMVAVMTMAPLQFLAMGAPLGVIGFVVSVHIAGMFAPSGLSGRLTDRIGGRKAGAIAAAILLLASTAAALSTGTGETSPVPLSLALLALGVGWNLALIAGSVLLAQDVPAAQRSRVEGWGEVSMGVAAAGGGLTCGPMTAAAGYAGLGVAGAAVAALAIPVALGLNRYRAFARNG